MKINISKWLNKKYPQNVILKNPYLGAFLISAFCTAFVILYKPFQFHPSRSFGFEMTMLIYFGTLSIPVFLMVKLLKKIKYFANPDEWTVLREILAILIILFAMGTVVYFEGFIMEPPAQRWNIATFMDSLKYGFLIGIVPFLFFAAINYRHLFVQDIFRNFNSQTLQLEQTEQLIQINSQLKKEELRFYPSQFLYAESDGNYVVFHLIIDNQVKEKLIRNSISNIEEQLRAIPFFMRTHRAFIVNIQKVISEKGNTLGYRLKLSGTEAEVPVSRQNTKGFDCLLKQYK